MTSNSLRDMYRLSGSSQRTSTTQNTSPQPPPATTAPQATASRPTSHTRRESGESVDSEDAGYWYLSGSQYPTPHSQPESTQPFFSSSQASSGSRPTVSSRQYSSETRRPMRSRAEDTRAQLGTTAPPMTSRSSDERPRYPSAPQPPATTRPYDGRPRYTSAPEPATLTQTAGYTSRPSSDRTRSSAAGPAISPATPQSATGTFRRADRPSTGTQPSQQGPPISYPLRQNDDRQRYSMRTADDRQRYSTVSQATTIAGPSSARASEDKQRTSGNTVPSGTTVSHDFARTGTTASGTTSGALTDTITTTSSTAPQRTVRMSAPHRLSTSGLESADGKPANTADDDDPSSSDALNLYDAPVTIQVFRALLGIPQDSIPLPLSNLRQAADRIDAGQTPLTPSTNRPLERVPTGKSNTQIAPSFKVRSRGPSWLPRWLRSKPFDTEYDTSVYYHLIKEQRKTQRLYVLYDVLVYVCLILQLIIAAVLIILGALNGGYHISIAILGAVTGVITGILSLIRGQGLPNRLMQYLDNLRKIRDDIEFTERELMANMRAVTYQECLDLRNKYEAVREDATKNHPDTWTSFSATSGGDGSAGGKTKDVEKGKPF